jgi:transglutaminase-like putative cysteine protease
MLGSTYFVDSDNEAVRTFAENSLVAVGLTSASDPTDKAIALFHAVRDGFRYDPYLLASDPDDYRASTIIATESNWCVPKSVVLTAAARAVGIPARLGFADVRNHLTSEKLSARMGTDLFAWHGYSELLLGDRWFKLSSAFNIELCERFGVKVLEFDGTDDALMHPYDQAGHRHMEYVQQRGSFDELPLDQIFADFAEIYPTMFDGAERVVGDDATDDRFHG